MRRFLGMSSTGGGESLGTTNEMQHAFTIDLEDWYQGVELPLSEWRDKESRLDKGLDVILALLAEQHTRCTFFCLGWIGENFPGQIRRITDEGHEIASHGYNHEKVYNFSPKEFREDVAKTKKILEEITGKEVFGYRAPFFSITGKSLWAFEALQDTGYRYDCSISPVKTWRYGVPRSPETIYRIKEFDIVEFPVSCFRMLNRRLGVGGAYFRIFPYGVFESFFSKKGEENLPGIFYAHPWEFDPHHPVIPLNWKARITHYSKLSTMHQKSERLLKRFRFNTVSAVIQHFAGLHSLREVSLSDLS